jgi:hypothetical protein
VIVLYLDWDIALEEDKAREQKHKSLLTTKTVDFLPADFCHLTHVNEAFFHFYASPRASFFQRELI